MMQVGVLKLAVVQWMCAWLGDVTGNLTEKGKGNNYAEDRGVGGRHSGVIVVVGMRSSVGGAIPRLDVGI